MLTVTRCSIPSTMIGSAMAASIRPAITVGQSGGVAAPGHAADGHELVAAHPADGVAAAGGRHDPGRRLDEDGVTGVMAVHVVDPLEAVEIAEQHGDLPCRSERSRARPRRSSDQAPVGQTGQRVVQGGVLQPGFGEDLFGDIDDGAGETDDGAVLVSGGKGVEPAHLAVIGPVHPVPAR